MYVPIGGIEQWIEIVGAGKPPLLFLHGGPGASSRPAAAAWQSWTDHFSVVHWDQRGTGRTFARNGAEGSGALTLARMVEDGLEVAAYVKDRLGTGKVLLVAHSWGTILAVHMLKRRPDLFSAYVGAAQIVDMRRNEEIKYATLIARAKAAGNREAEADLARIGPPPHEDLDAMRILVRWADALTLGEGDPIRPRPRPRSADFTEEDGSWLVRGLEFSSGQLYREIAAVDLATLGPAFAVPMFFFHGTEDLLAPLALVESYVEAIAAPRKELVFFPDCHHFLAINRPEDFLAEILARVAP